MNTRSFAQRLLLTARTLRHLEVGQLSSYAVHATRRRLMPWIGPAVAPLTARWAKSALHPNEDMLTTWSTIIPDLLLLGDDALENARHFADGRPTLLGEEVDFAAGFDWGYQEKGRLWEYQLHYLDTLVPLALAARGGSAVDLERLERLTRSWRENNPLGKNAGWEPYPTSLRVINLLRTAALLPPEEPLRQSLLEDVARQAGVLAACLETHLKANHLLSNLKAIVLATVLLPDHPVLRRQRNRFFRLLEKEIELQFLPDGGHYERSPMYHSLLTGTLVELALVLGSADGLPAGLATQLKDRAVAATAFLEAIRHPDGGLPFFNDGNLEEDYRPAGMRAFLESHGGDPASDDPLRIFADTGYIVVRRGPWHLIWDCGPIGPDHQPGHGHADILSFEVSVDKQRLLTNSGLKGYAHDDTRPYSRSTRAHNTVQIGEEEQVELWSSFRVGRRARPTLERADIEGDNLHLAGSYRWPTLSNGPTHRRTWHLEGTDTLTCLDELEGIQSKSARAFLHVHPDVKLEPTEDGFVLRTAGRDVHLRIQSDMSSLDTTPYFPQFGHELERPCVILSRRGDGALQFQLSL